MSWPRTVPVLTAKDIARGVFHLGDKHCLRGWVHTIFGAREKRLVVAALEEQTGRAISLYNDRNPKSAVAGAWNGAMRRLGYTEVSET